MRVGRVLDASDPRIESKSINPPRRARRPRREWGPEKQLLLKVNEHEGPLTSIDRQTLRSMGQTPWDEVPGHDGQSYAEAHGVSHEDLYEEIERSPFEDDIPEDETAVQRLARIADQHKPIFAPPGITEPQEKLIENRLLPELQTINAEVYGIAHDWYRDMRAAGKMTKAKATEMIGRLKHHCGYEEKGWAKRADFRVEGRPDREMDVPAKIAPEPIDYFDDIPDAYYALRDAEDSSHIIFYRVSTWARPWKDEDRPGRKVQHVVGGDKLYPMNRVAARTILRQIREAGPRKAAKLYADEIGQCCRCNRTLTDDHSREVGMGPTCESKGW